MIVTVWPFQGSGRMSTYTVHEPPAPAADRMDRAEAMVFVREAFSWAAFLLGPVWLLVNRLWLALAAYVAAAVAAGALLSAAGAAEGWNAIVMLALNAIVAYEAHALRVAKMTATGWSMAGAVMGGSLAECERRFFDQWLPSQPVLRPRPGSGPGGPQPEGDQLRHAPPDDMRDTLASDRSADTSAVARLVASRRRLASLFRRRE